MEEKKHFRQLPLDTGLYLMSNAYIADDFVRERRLTIA